MASAADIAVESSNYQGNANLGGGNFGVVQIDTKPLADLAAYTFTYNKAMYEQKQKDMEATASEYAKLSDYDLNSAIPKDRDEILKGYNELFDYVKNDPTVLDFKNNQAGWLEYQKKRTLFENNLNSGKARSAMYTVRQNEATDAMDPQTKVYLQTTLDQEANSTDLNTPLKHSQLYDVAPVQITAAPIKKLDFTKIGTNFNDQRTYDLPDVASARSQANQKSLGFTQDAVDETSAEFKSKTPEEQAYLHNQKISQTASGKLEPVESAKAITDILADPKYQAPEFRSPDGSLDIDKVIAANPDNKLLTGVLTAVKQTNDNFHRMKGAIASGLKDNLGNQLTYGQGGLSENDFRDIDLSKGLSTSDLLLTRIMGASIPASYKTTVTQTNLGIDQQNADTSKGRLTEDIRKNKADELQKAQDLKDKADRWAASVKGGDPIKNAAMQKAKRIYSDLEKLADKNGVITPDKIRKLNTEQLKYLGTQKTGTDAAGNPTTSYEPLDVVKFSTTGADGTVTKKAAPHAIQLENGNVHVLTDAIPSASGSGSFQGNWDPTKSTNVYNMATNIINEENKVAGNNSELNAYMGSDDPNSPGVTTSGAGSGSYSGSGSTRVIQKNITEMTPDEMRKYLNPDDFKKEGNNYRYKDGTLVDQNGKIIKK